MGNCDLVSAIMASSNTVAELMDRADVPIRPGDTSALIDRNGYQIVRLKQAGAERTD